ncbi:MAG: restriction endonuclease subunit S, partial [Eubacteriales bacterium]
YLSISQNFRDIAIKSMVGTTGRQRVQQSVLENNVIKIPPYHEQRAIAETLSCLDDKIEINNRINKTLEEMAQAIFKSWFVDFEPFQDGALVESELGRIPKGWRVGKLSELIIIKYGKDHKKLSDGNIPVYGSGGVMRYVDTAIFSTESVLIPRKGTLNNVIYVDEPFWSVDTMFYTVMRTLNVAKFVYFYMKDKDLASMNAGSAVPSMTTDILYNLVIVIPPDEVTKRFDVLVSPLFTKIKANQIENKTLTLLRDILLPKLMSGEIRVPV